MKILAIGAHPDDIEIFMFGILCHFKNKGDSVNLLIATDGSLGGKGNKENLKNKRKNEAVLGLKYLGKPLFLGIQDGMLGAKENHYFLIKKSIKNVNPDLIITHSSNDYHSDHRNLSKLVQNIASHYVPILCCDTMMGINFVPNYYIDITKYFSDKQKSILCHKSQNPRRFAKLAKLMNRFRSAQCNAPENNYAEAYFFNQSFPFSDIRNILPESPSLRSFEIETLNGFL